MLKNIFPTKKVNKLSVADIEKDYQVGKDHEPRIVVMWWLNPSDHMSATTVFRQYAKTIATFMHMADKLPPSRDLPYESLFASQGRFKFAASEINRDGRSLWRFRKDEMRAENAANS